MKKVVLVTSLAVVTGTLFVFILHMKNAEVAKADICEYTYVLDWSDPTTYTVDCGDVNASNWSVKGLICNYYSPVFNVGGNIGDPAKLADIIVRINQSGNLDNNDTAWVFMYANGALVHMYTCIGGGAPAVFSTSQTITVPAGGTYSVSIKLKNDKTNELWQIKNGDVTSCLRSMSPLPVSIGDFAARVDASDAIHLNWNTFTEINNDYFTLERSATGTDFTELARLDGAGNSTSVIHYTYIDKNPLAGVNYYRLRQTDFDGTVRTSHIIKAETSDSKANASPLQVFPNPFTSSFSIRFESEMEQDIEVRVAGLDGRIRYRESFRAALGRNTFLCNPPDKLEKGNLLVQVAGDGKTIHSAKAIHQ